MGHEFPPALHLTKCLKANFPDAPQSVVAVVRGIQSGQTPTENEILALGADVDRSWSSPFPSVHPTYGHTLLREAVMHRNFAAAMNLVKVGADPFFNENEMAFLAVTYRAPGPRVWFPDYRPGLRFLNLWLSQGGQPSAQNAYHAGFGDVLYNTPMDNLEAILVLLRAGADPWVQTKPEGSLPGETFSYPSFFEGLANGQAIHAEVAFRIAHDGFYRGGPRKSVDGLVANYERVAAQFVDATGPSDLSTAWLLQRVLRSVFEQLERDPGQAVDAVMSRELPDGVGGFFLAPEELRSRDAADQRVNTENLTGSELWHAG